MHLAILIYLNEHKYTGILTQFAVIPIALWRFFTKKLLRDATPRDADWSTPESKVIVDYSLESTVGEEFTLPECKFYKAPLYILQSATIYVSTL